MKPLVAALKATGFYKKQSINFPPVLVVFVAAPFCLPYTKRTVGYYVPISDARFYVMGFRWRDLLKTMIPFCTPLRNTFCSSAGS